MQSEESSSPSSSITTHSMINASTQMKRVGRKRTRHPRRSKGGEVRVPYASSVISLATPSPPVQHLPEMAVDGSAPAVVHSGDRLLPPDTSFSHQDIEKRAAPVTELIVEGSSSINGGVEFVDEEAVFNMPLLVDSMAEAMLLTPPAMKKGFSWSQEIHDDDDDDLIHSMTLWND